MAKPTKPEKKTRKPKAQIHTVKSLGLNRHALPHSIVEVVGSLTRAGFDAYIVGGGVRDSLLGLIPKDFDAVTSARPHEIKSVFGGRCRIIGRRFQLAHVYSGKEMIEVATFRAPPKDDTHTTEDGMITRDNVWGTIEQDFARRDFSINALYYQPNRGEVLDFCGAIDDIKSKKLRLLGDAKTRIEEDPVRLLRALRFKAKLDFEFDADLAAQFNEENWALLEQVSTHRLYDETQKMFSGGYLAPLLPLLYEYRAMAHLVPYVSDAPSRLVQEIAINTDKRVAQDLGVNPAFFYAGLLWENYLYQLAKFKKKGLPFYEAQARAAAKTIDTQRLKTAIPRFAEEFITDIWLMQTRLANPRLRDIETLSRHAKFRVAFDFLVMREAFDDHVLSEPTGGMGAWWHAYQLADASQKALLVERLGRGEKGRRRQRGGAMDLGQVDLDGLALGAGEKSPITDKKSPTKKPSPMPVPTFEKVAYSEADFLRLLNSDEPFIPSQRYRKREPSSTLSIREREQLASGESDSAKKPKKQTKPKKAKASKGDKAKPEKLKDKAKKGDKTDPKPKKSTKKKKKSNAKPKADS